MIGNGSFLDRVVQLKGIEGLDFATDAFVIIVVQPGVVTKVTGVIVGSIQANSDIINADSICTMVIYGETFDKKGENLFEICLLL